MTLNETLLAACRAHAPQFDRMDDEIRKYAMEQMRSALLAAVANLVLSIRSVLADGLPDDPENSDLVRALEPFEELVAYDDTVEADIGAAMAATSTPAPREVALSTSQSDPAPEIAEYSKPRDGDRGGGRTENNEGDTLEGVIDSNDHKGAADV
ncbi:hypothetical protein [Rhizobium rhizogenes]|uniref:hypothetical protein n=1 Tax=Rhizobium rhizogenes TaxID=359 RepID=UPI001571838E|nr:hypothetical protein [Rhizobium rhizogenes]NTG07184.1 hypothetical protein [Rhizobium rhizogenes]